MNTTKPCRTCGESKPLTGFPKTGRVCKACTSARQKAWYYANHERELAKQMAHYFANRDAINASRRKGKPPELTAEERRRRQLASNKRWTLAHPEETAVIRRRWNEKNHEKALESRRKWKREHPDAVLADTKRRQARKKGAAVHPLTTEQRQQRLWLYGPVCTYCGKTCRTDVPRYHPDKATEDHQIPLSRGGPDCGANLRLACHACNLRKGSRTPREWRDECKV